MTSKYVLLYGSETFVFSGNEKILKTQFNFLKI